MTRESIAGQPSVSIKSFESISENVFADLGDQEPDRTVACAQAMLRIIDILSERGLTQAEELRRS